jgi:hypothetical protein
MVPYITIREKPVNNCFPMYRNTPEFLGGLVWKIGAYGTKTAMERAIQMIRKRNLRQASILFTAKSLIAIA